jgi:hypothetical protein
VQLVTELQQQTLRQLRIDGPELGQGAMALVGLQQTEVGEGQLKAAAIQIPIHSGSSAIRSHRATAEPARRGWSDQQVALLFLPRSCASGKCRFATSCVLISRWGRSIS